MEYYDTQILKKLIQVRIDQNLCSTPSNTIETQKPLCVH